MSSSQNPGPTLDEAADLTGTDDDEADPPAATPAEDKPEHVTPPAVAAEVVTVARAMPSVEAATPIWVSEASSEPPRAAACNPTVTALHSTSGTTMDDIIAVSMAASAAGGVAEAESTSSTDHAMPE